MTEWNKFKAVMVERATDTEIPVYVYGVTQKTALDKLKAEYSSRKYTLKSMDLVAE